jgi:hypothetical protein
LAVGYWLLAIGQKKAVGYWPEEDGTYLANSR